MRRSSPEVSGKYLRFRTTLREPGVSGPLGVFGAVGSLRDAEKLDSAAERQLEKICQWFNHHLPVPTLKPEHWRAVFWFRPDCRNLLQKLWELVAVLRDQAVPVELLTTSDPGTICYADRYQVAAIPRRTRRGRNH